MMLLSRRTRALALLTMLVTATTVSRCNCSFWLRVHDPERHLEYRNPVFVVYPIVLFALPMGKERKILRVCRHNILVGTPPISVVKRKKRLVVHCDSARGDSRESQPGSFLAGQDNALLSNLLPSAVGVSCATCFLWVDWAGVALFHVAPFGGVPDSCSEIFEGLAFDYRTANQQQLFLPSRLPVTSRRDIEAQLGDESGISLKSFVRSEDEARHPALCSTLLYSISGLSQSTTITGGR